ncbi:MAG: polyprenyl synthetase family protein, partial [Lachnospiraceae bacterium]|nr:polyprenyl synthetase family protein [Lachnospiraceae bacterium]
FDRVPADGEDTALTSNIIRSLRILADKAGINGMIGGQVVDVISEDKGADEITMDIIKFIHENKTAAMIESSMMIGASLAGATQPQIDIIEKTGSDIGLAFQIRDDILDITGDGALLGKPIGSDERNGKATYVSIAGLDKAKDDVRILSERAVGNLQSLPGSDADSGLFLKELIEYLIDRDR